MPPTRTCTWCGEILQSPRAAAVTRVHEVRCPAVVGRVPHLDVLGRTCRCCVGRRRRRRRRGRRRKRGLGIGLGSESGCVITRRWRHSLTTHHGRVLSRIVRANAAHPVCCCRARQEKRANTQLITRAIAGAKPKHQVWVPGRDLPDRELVESRSGHACTKLIALCG